MNSGHFATKFKLDNASKTGKNLKNFIHVMVHDFFLRPYFTIIVGFV